MPVGIRKPLSLGVVSLCVLVGGLVFASAPVLAAEPPEAPVTGEANPVTTTTATLNGEVEELNPEDALEVGTYEFLYRESTTTCEGGKTAPVPAGVALSKEPVSQSLSGLLPGTTYTFCLLTRNAAEETALGAPVTFTTHGVGITEEQVSTVEASAATLQADINPGGSETRYHFEYDTTPYTTSAAHGTSITTEGVGKESSIASGTTPEPVEVRLESLQPGKVYYYRVVASNEAGTFDGPGKAFTTNPAPGSEPPQNCLNEQRRAEQPFAQALPDCRAYEMASPVQTLGQDATDASITTGPRAAPSGEAIAYTSRGSFGTPSGANLESELVSRREENGWATQDITPLFNPPGTYLESAYAGLVFTPELTEGIASTTAKLTEAAPTPGGEERDLYLADFATGGYRYLAETRSPMGASTDLSRVVFGEQGEVSEWLNGSIVPVSVSNEGQPLNASVGDAAQIPQEGSRIKKDVWHAVSGDGSRVYFTSPAFSEPGDVPIEDGRQLYVRVNSQEPQSPLTSPEANGTGTLTKGSDTVSSLITATGILSGGVSAGSTEFPVETTTIGRFLVGQEIVPGPQFEPGTTITSIAGGTITVSKPSIAIVNAISAQGSAPFVVGEGVSGNGVSPGTTITAVAAGSLTLSAPALVSGGPVELRAGGGCTVAGDACTVDVSASERFGRENLQGIRSARYWDASADGSRVLFTSDAELTEDAHTSATAANLYEYDLEKPEGKRLTDLTVDETDAEGAAVQGIAQISENGAYVYFVAHGVLTHAPNAQGVQPVAGQPNLYMVHDGGAPVFVATLAQGEGDRSDWSAFHPEETGPGYTSAVVSPGGGYLGFMSERGLTGYDNRQARAGECEGKVPESGGFEHEVGNCREAFVYDAVTGGLVCASCNPSGARPVGPAEFRTEIGEQFVQYRPRQLSEDGTLFFDSSDALVPHASDGRENVYEYEHGHVYPISNVTGGHESFFLDSGEGPNGEEGGNVFFATADQLLPEDVGNNVVVYDARIGGGFPVVASVPACSNADSCKPPESAQPEVFGAPASATFSGPGNPVAPPSPSPTVVKPKTKTVKCAKGERLEHGRCVKRRLAKKATRSSEHHRRGK